MAASAGGGSNGGGGSVLGKIGEMLGGALGGQGEALAGLAKSGLSPDKIPDKRRNQRLIAAFSCCC